MYRRPNKIQMLLKGVFVLVTTLIQQCLGFEGISQSTLEKLSKIETDRLILNGSDFSHFTHFNTTRTPSSKESLYIQKYIKNHFDYLNEKSAFHWEIETDTFEEKNLNFTNIVLTKGPISASKYILLAAHYDSLTTIPGFIGAIDSAISCGILLDIAESLNSILDDNFSDESYDLDVGFKIVFFDGEEALEKWSPTDSIYGARHLHKQWYENDSLGGIELFVLLDLLGSKSTLENYIPSYFPQTHDTYIELSTLETRLIQIKPELFGSLQDLAPVTGEAFSREYYGVIEDDHIPFLRSKIPVLHLIPNHFPTQWHTIADDFSLADPVAIKRWTVLLRAFVAQYLELE